MSRAVQTKPCPHCGKPMPKNRGVCPECGGMTTWFRIRFYVGCASLLLATFGMITLLLMALFGTPPE